MLVAFAILGFLFVCVTIEICINKKRSDWQLIQEEIDKSIDFQKRSLHPRFRVVKLDNCDSADINASVSKEDGMVLESIETTVELPNRNDTVLTKETLNKDGSSVKVIKIKIKNKNKWTKADLEFLKNNYGEISVPNIRKELKNRHTANAIYKKWQSLNK